MALEADSNHLVGEGQSTVRPPLFVGENYAYWKTRMKLFIQASDYEVWRIVQNGPIIPMKKVGDQDVVKQEEEWDTNDLKSAQLNAKAMHTLFCALGASEYNRVSLCENAKEVWDKLQVTHEGTNRVKETKIGMLTHEYELFSMKQEETITEMYNRFTTIVNNLKGLGKAYGNKELVKKVLNSLPKSWEAKVTAIEESKDPNTFPMDELVGSLLTHEMKLKQGEDVIKKAQESIKKVGVALKSTTCKEDQNHEGSDEDEEMAMFARKFNKFMRMKRFGNARRPQRKEIMKGESSKKEKDPIVCYECKKPGHIKFECPLLKKQSSRKPYKKAMMATWSDSDISEDESHDDDEVANLCFMALDDPKVILNTHDSNAYTFDELQDAFDELAIDFESMNVKYKKMIAKLSIENVMLTKAKIELEKNLECMTSELDVLSKKNENLQNSFSRFYMGQQKLDMMLETQRAFFDKNGLGFDSCIKETHLKNFFAKSSDSHETSSTCAYCKRIGHSIHHCPSKIITFRRKIVRSIWIPKGMNASINVKAMMEWIPKGTKIVNSNAQGPKKIWVPKTKV